MTIQIKEEMFSLNKTSFKLKDITDQLQKKQKTKTKKPQKPKKPENSLNYVLFQENKVRDSSSIQQLEIRNIIIKLFMEICIKN